MKQIILVPAFLLALSSGFLSGRMLATHNPDIILQDDNRQAVPTVQIEGITNGIVHGTVMGNARFIWGKHTVVQDGVFTFDASDVLKNTVHIVVPDGMHFVASKRGKKYYPVFSAGGSGITPGNRIYFQTEKEALDAGYKK